MPRKRERASERERKRERERASARASERERERERASARASEWLCTSVYLACGCGFLGEHRYVQRELDSEFIAAQVQKPIVAVLSFQCTKFLDHLSKQLRAADALFAGHRPHTRFRVVFVLRQTKILELIVACRMTSLLLTDCWCSPFL